MNVVVQVMPLRVVKVTPSDTCQMKSSSKNIQLTAQCSFSSFLWRGQLVSRGAALSSVSPVLLTRGARQGAFHVVRRVTIHLERMWHA